MKKLFLILICNVAILSLFGSADIPLSVTTAATGTNWTAFPSQVCTYVLVTNVSGTDIGVDRGGSGTWFYIPNNSAMKINVNGNANELSTRRIDTSNTQVTIFLAAGKSSI